MKRLLLLLALAGMILAFAGCELGGAEEALKPIAQPYISIQPRSASYYVEDYTPTALEIEIWDWIDEDGDLSYQWYTFTDIEDYCQSGSGTRIGGATGISYTPTEITPADGAKFYYYVEVTNRNPDAAGTGQVQSQMAVISFSAAGTPLAPIISRHPSNARYGWGAQLNALRVNAALPQIASGDNMVNAPGSITYQWYVNDRFSVEGATAIPEANQSMLIPDPDTFDLGDNYFFVIVTNTYGSGANNTATATSVPAVITLEPGIRAAAPRIGRQPQDALYFAGEAVQPLTVEAESLDRGRLTYQWYRNSVGVANSSKPGSGKTEALNSDGTAIAGATTASFMPDDVDTSAAGNYYYYVEITNTNNNVREEKFATVASRAVKIRVAGATGSVAPNAVFTIPDTSLPANRYQYIRGYGGMDVAWGNFPETYPEDTELMYDPDRMGFNMLRVMIKPNYVDVEQTMEELLGTDRPHYYTNVKIVNGYGGYVEASPWTPPKEWKSNNSINGGGILIPTYYRLFANYLRSFAQLMHDQGAPIYAISIANEPNYVAGYDGCEWTGAEMMEFFLQVGHFTDGIRGYGGGRETPYVLTVNGESANTPNINLPALRNPVSKAAIDVVARHVYGERRVSLWNDNKADITRPDGSVMEVWMTEHNINSANATGYFNDSTWNYIWRYMNDVDLVIRMNNENAFVWWASKRFYSMIGDGQFGTTDGEPLPRGWGMSHYSRYTVDATRIRVNLEAGSTLADGTTLDPMRYGWGTNPYLNFDDGAGDMDNLSARVTAFESADGNTISLIIWMPTKTDGSGGYDLGTMEFRFPAGFTAQGVSAHRSWGDDNEEIMVDGVPAYRSQLFQPWDWEDGYYVRGRNPGDPPDWVDKPRGVQLSEDRAKAYITMGRGEMMSLKFTK